MKHRPWTPEEDAFLIACHGSLTAKKQAERLGRSYTCVVAKRMRLYRKGLIQKYKRKYLREWSQADIEYLQEHYASSNLEALQKRLKRSKVAIFLKKKRIGGILRADGSTYTAREIGRLFGRDTKWITALAEKGYIKGKRAPYRQGPYRPWAFTDADLTRFVRRYPWLINVNKMEDGQYWKNLVKREWERDPWYSLKEAAAIVNITPYVLLRRLRSGEVKGHQRSPGAKWSYWGIRLSGLAPFRRHDGHEERSAASKKQMRARRVRAGLPYILRVVWGLTCPKCGQEITVEAGSHAKAPEVLRMIKHECGKEVACSPGPIMS